VLRFFSSLGNHSDDYKRQIKLKKRSVQGDESLSLEFDGEKITSEKFLKASSAFLNLIKEVSAEVTGSRKVVQTLVSVESGSVHVIAHPTIRKGEGLHTPHEINSVILGGLSQLERGAESAPEYFNRKALSDARLLSSLLSGKDKLTKLAIRREGEAEAALSPQTFATVEKLLGTKYEAQGSVEGVLRTLSDEDEGLRFYVHDVLNDDRIVCEVPETYLSKAFELFRHRVVVYGLVRFGKDGYPNSIVVEEIVALPNFENLPPVDSFRGILKT